MTGLTAGGAMDYASRLESFRESDRARDAMVEELINSLNELQTKYNEKCDDYSKSKVGGPGRASGSNNFALAILDGDGAVFQDHLLALGNDGGAQAAFLLHTEIRNQLKAAYPDSNVADWSIVVNVVLNLQGLGRKLQACGLISHPDQLVEFGRGFSLAQPLFNFIDVGSGKERADHKVREMLRLFLPNAQCKHVFFGPCHDNGYLPVFEQYRLDPATSKRLTLVETTAAEVGYARLNIPRIKLDPVFRSENLPSKPLMSSPTHTMPLRMATGMNGSSVPFVPISNGATHTSPSPSPAPSVMSDDLSSWAAVGKNGAATGKTIDVKTKKAAPKKFVLVNAYDERVDEPIPQPEPKAFMAFTRKYQDNGYYCNNYHLNGKCPSGEYCSYYHGERLPGPERLVVKHKARQLVCPNKEFCRDPDCYLGHHCQHGWNCRYGQDCNFSETHNRDRTKAKRVYEDGTEEWDQDYLKKLNKK